MSGWQKTASGSAFFLPVWALTTVLMAISELVAKLHTTQSQATINKHIPFMTLNIIFLSTVLIAGLTVILPFFWPDYPDTINILLPIVFGPLILAFLLVTNVKAREHGRHRLRTWGHQRGLTWGPFAEESSPVTQICIIPTLETHC